MDFARHLKSQINIVEVVGERVKLRRVGATPRYTGLCPFHTEKTPSFHVHQDHQFYYCFGCQAKGDVYNFLMQMDGFTFYEAMKSLADRYGIQMPQRSEHADRETRLRELIYRANEIALRLFRRNLEGSQGAEARQYLAGRGVNADVAEQYGIGLSDRNGTLLDALRREGYTADQLEETGLISKRQDGSGFYERFRGRLMFTIWNESGKIAGFAGRAMVKGEEPKYMNSPQTAVYSKSNLLYNLNRARDAARKAGRFILVEGYMDVIGLSMGGIGEAVASCGTALTAEQVRMMKRFCGQVIVNFDPDTGGVRGTERSIQLLLDEHIRVRVLELDQDMDPDEYVAQFGADAYLQLLDRAPNYYFWLADQARKRFDSRTAEGRTQALEYLLPAVHRIPDKIERAGVAGDLAAYLGVDRGLVLDEFKKAALDRREKHVTPRQPQGARMRQAERILLSSLLRFAPLRGEYIERMRAIERWEAAQLFRCLFDLYEIEPDFGYPDLEARLEEKDRALLSSIVFADETEEEDLLEAARANVDACLVRLEAEQEQHGIETLRREIRAAEQRGDLHEALRLALELDQRRKRQPFTGNQ